MSLGMLLAYAGVAEGHEVSWLPSYGPEMRGGTANCHVVLSDEPIGSPLVAEASCVIAMNEPSFDKYESSVAAGGIFIINSSIINKRANRSDIDYYYVPCNDIAVRLGNPRVANMVMLGAFIELTKAVSFESIINAIPEVLGPGKEKLIQINEEALNAGAKEVKR